MTRYGKRVRALAACLSALAGYVDAIGFLALGGFFVSFMSGNTTRMGVGLAEGASAAGTAAGLIGLFVLGVMAGSFTGHLARARRRPVVLALVAALLAAAAALGQAGAPRAAAVAMVLAMGAENAVFERDGEVSISLTYMTGTLVKFAQRLTAALLGGDRWAWTPFLALWTGLAAGAVTGALAYGRIGLAALWFAASAAALMVPVCAVLGADDDGTGPPRR